MALRLAAIVLVLLTVSPTVEAWTQARGSADRGHASASLAAPLDVLAFANLSTGDGDVRMPGVDVLETPHGLLMLATSEEEACDALRLPRPDAPAEAERLPIADCGFGLGSLQGYDAVNDTVFVCFGGGPDDPIFSALDARTLELEWYVAPSRNLGIGTQVTVLNNRWDCGGSAFDLEAREIVVPFQSLQNGGTMFGHRLAGISMDTGYVVWVSEIPAQSLYHPAVGVVGAGAGRQVVLQTATLTSSGIVVRGRALCPECAPSTANTVESVAAWFTREGGFRGARFARTQTDVVLGTTPDPRVEGTPPASEFAVAVGPLAYLALGGNLLIVNPGTAAPVVDRPLEAIEPTTSFVLWPPASRLGDLVLVALPHSFFAMEGDALGGEVAWTYSEGQSWILSTLAPLDGGTVLALLWNPLDDLVAISSVGADGRLLSRVQLPIPPGLTNDGFWYSDMSVLADGRVIVTDNLGQYVLLGAAPAHLQPEVGVSTLYPALREPVALRMPEDPEVARYQVNWGEGDPQTVEPGAVAEHAFASRGIRDISVTALYRDGRTGTRVLALDVGGAPPPQLTAIQKAFSPENQNWTFFLIGMLLTVGGAVYTVGRTRARFSRLERELAAVEEIRVLSTQDPRGAVLALKAYRERLPLDLARRRIDDSQYSVLEARSARLLKVLRTRMFAPFDARISARYHRLLDAAFEDATLQPSEAEVLSVQLDDEPGLAPADRAAIRAILVDFTSEHASLGLRR